MIRRSRPVRALAASIAVATLLVACRTAPVLTPRFTFPTDEGRNETRMADAIKAADLRYGWEIQEDGPGQMTGTLRLRKHTAVVSITYDASSYQIQYKDSTQLMYKAGKIHRNYNRWVNNLSDEIKAQLGYGT